MKSYSSIYDICKSASNKIFFVLFHGNYPFLTSFYFATGISFIESSLNRNWFTTSDSTLDPWIYWGAGDNLPLNYSNGFSQLYYLQRYVVIIPQIFAQTIFGPYYSQIFLAFIYIFFISLFTILICGLIDRKAYSIPILLILFGNRKFIGMIAMSYTQSASILWFLIAAYFILKSIIQNSRSSALLFGFAAGCLSNAYLPHFLILIFSSLMLLKINKFRKISFIFPAVKGFIFFEIGLQLLYFIVTRSFSIIILDHLKIGYNLASAPNPWGGNGFGWFWTRGAFLPQSLYWTVLLSISFFMSLFKKNFFSSKVQYVIAFFVYANLGMCFFSFYQTNITAYSWISCILYLILIPAVIIILETFNLENKVALFLSFLFYLFFKIIYLYLNYSESFLSSTNIRNSIYFLIFCVVLSRILLKPFIFSKIFALLVICVLLSIQPKFFDFLEGGLPKTTDAKSLYYKLSYDRSLILDIMRITNGRVWLTPDVDVPLMSSVLYNYSLISDKVGVSSCKQVEWARNSNSVIVLIRSSKLKEAETYVTYLEPCGVKESKWFQAHNVKDLSSYMFINS